MCAFFRDCFCGLGLGLGLETLVLTTRLEARYLDRQIWALKADSLTSPLIVTVTVTVTVNEVVMQ